MRRDGTLFNASTVHIDHITTALNCLIPFGIKEEVIIFIDNDGLSFARELNHVMRIQLFLARELFMSFSYDNGNDNEEPTKVCVKISHLLDSFNVANRNIDDVVECTMSYDGYGSPFVLIFEDSTVSERVEYSTYLVQGSTNGGLEIDRDQVIFECIIKGDVLYAAMNELKETGCKECYLFAKTNDNGDHVFALISDSQLGLSKIRLPNSRSILEKLEIYDTDYETVIHGRLVIASFDFNLFDKMRMSIRIASKVLFKMDAHGLLSVNILSQTDDVLVSETRPTINRARSLDGPRQMQLPRDYPGIVVEVCLIEREQFDDSAKRNIEILMDSGEREKAASSGIGAGSNSRGNIPTFHREEIDLQNGRRASPFKNDLPLFF
ncbi:hypothetical protein HG536_0F04610 [Torulaspora globosa]|uniref:DNA damage checkpoint control protein RAD17 n=1 Tax=Torulaspora globosa TaxID=48254 RepID=A0A7G3ZKU9_9SACH|nr:uncharacterized protein HG536_0F04610 [Torulaspora globosa]QLL34135.1 hypothetical protein HG536_0F04610 [Torulaspora globosa]